MDTEHHSTSLLPDVIFPGQEGELAAGYGGCQMLRACSGWVHLHPVHSPLHYTTHALPAPHCSSGSATCPQQSPPTVPQEYRHTGVSLSLSPQLFQQFGNMMANQFWAANVPPSEAISPASGSQERRRFVIAKYREGKYRRYHPLFGNQEELDRVSGPQGWASARGFCLGRKWG